MFSQFNPSNRPLRRLRRPSTHSIYFLLWVRFRDSSFSINVQIRLSFRRHALYVVGCYRLFVFSLIAIDELMKERCREFEIK